MPTPTVTVEAAFGLPNPGDFVVGSSLVGGPDVVSSGFNPVTSSAELVTIQRGRWSQVTDVIDAGDMTVQVLNLDRTFDPTFTTSPYYGRVRPGLSLRVSATASGYSARPLMTGRADEVQLEYDVDGRSVTIFRATDALGQLGAAEFDQWTSNGTSVHAKLTDSCQRPEVAFATEHTDFDPGIELLQGDSVTWGSNVLNYLQLVARSELGYLFVTADGVLTFRDRTAGGSGSPAVTFGGSSGVQFQSIQARYGEFLFSRVGVDREGGTNQTAEVADLDAWKAANGSPRSLSLTGLLLDSDAQALALAEYLLELYSLPRYQVAEIGVELAALTAAQQDAVLALDITDVVAVEFAPNNIGPAITQELLVQGIAHDLTPASHLVRLSLIAIPRNLFIVGSSLVGGPDVIAF